MRESTTGYKLNYRVSNAVFAATGTLYRSVGCVTINQNGPNPVGGSGRRQVKASPGALDVRRAPQSAITHFLDSVAINFIALALLFIPSIQIPNFLLSGDYSEFVQEQTPGAGSQPKPILM